MADINTTDSSSELLHVNHLKVHFPIRNGFMGRVSGHVKAVDDVSFSIGRGETLGLVGESGSGKTTLGRSILRAINPTDGEINFDFSVHDGGHGGEKGGANGHVKGHTNSAAHLVNVAKMSESALRPYRRHMQMIFQDPYSSLNPRMTVRDIIAEPLVAMDLMQGSALEEQIRTTATRCRLSLEHLRRFPHAFSGGQRQRIGIARALVSNPQFIVCDESVSALDVSIQADILNLLMDLQEELNLTYLFIAHDLSVVAHISTRVAVMYVGQLVELAPTRKLFYTPKHPYTEALLSAIPDVDPEKNINQIQLVGEIPNPAAPPSGCRFHTRCAYVQEQCRSRIPEWTEIEADHFVACHFADELALKGAS